MKKKLLLFLLVIDFTSYATIYQVGSTKTYVSPNALYTANLVQDGDTIEIDAETYTGQAALAAWQSNNLLIKGVGGKPHLVADGQYILGKGIWVLAGNDITVENIEFSGATVPDQNGAGIRLDGTGLTVRYCYFHDNENGILTSNPYAGDVLIEYSEFGYNGFGDGFTHNLYIGHVNKLTFRFNYSHHTDIGHNLKSRANENYIMYNRIMDEQTGNSSRLIDLSNGGFSIIMGNLLMQGNNAPNNNMVGYGLEGLSNTSNELYLINNTFVNKRTASCLFVSIETGTTVANITNNVFAGTGTVISGTTTTMSNNVIDPTISNLNFANELNYDYHLNSNSPAVNAGTVVSSVNGYSLTPDSSYMHPVTFELRTMSSTIDAGAYEYNPPSSITDMSSEKIAIFPNPVIGTLTVDFNVNQIQKITIINTLGKVVLSQSNSNKIDLSSMYNGIYYLKVEINDGTYFVEKIIVE